MNALALGLLLLGAAPHLAPAAPWSQLPESKRAERLSALQTQPLGERLEAVSAGFLGTPYLVSPLGEGAGRDPDPLIRYDAVDCLTFVEETLAMALAPHPDAVVPLLSALRYGHDVAYEDRNHLMEAQWLPHNIAKGYLRDVTANLGGAWVTHTQKVLSAASWRSTSSRALGLSPARQLEGTYPLEMVPFKAALEVAREAPTGTLLLVVREDLPWKVTRISHLGFLVRAGGRVYLRHATKGWVNRVVDEDLGHFLARISRHNETDPWKVVGISLYAAQQPAPQAARLP